MLGTTGDERPYTNTIYVNKDNRCLLIFKEIANHKAIQKMLRDTKETTVKVFVEQEETALYNITTQLSEYYSELNTLGWLKEDMETVSGDLALKSLPLS